MNLPEVTGLVNFYFKGVDRVGLAGIHAGKKDTRQI
jgi:hypothetical protein